MLDLRLLRRADFVMLATVILLAALGVLMIQTCTAPRPEGGGASATAKRNQQLVFVFLGLIVMAVMASVDYAALARLHLVIYVAVCVLLAAVLFTAEIRGTRRWFNVGPVNLQPAELSKLALIITLASVAASQRLWETLRGLLLALAWALPPLMLILAEPDLGTPVVLVAIWLTMMYCGGARLSQLASLCSAGVLVGLAGWFSPLLKAHQKARLLAFANPSADPQGAGWHLTQSLIAIGNGGLRGRGLFNGTQTNGRFISDQSTDFIFTALAEQWGFIGSLLLLALLGVLLWRCTVVIAEAKDPLGRLLAAGATAVLVVHVTVNLGMTMGLLPVKGMPLPFVSYGGSAMLTMMALVGLLQSVYMRRHKIAF